ncbi:MAG: hypothetical protein LBU60_00975 [Clostridiales bacterium]|jgi:hypothetical protein|nr:hypothetical protein [Clostridiales bacterium]
MEIVTAVNLWKDMDFDTPDLEVSIVDKFNKNGVAFIEAYFTAVKFETTCIRVFCRLAKRVDDIAPPVIMIADDIDMSFEKRNVDKYLDKGFAVFQYDYLGAREGASKTTLYPNHLEHCIYKGNKSDMTRPVKSYKDSCWYYWSIVSFRAVAMLNWLHSDMRKAFYIGENIAIVGFGVGGAHAIKVATIFDKIQCVVVKFDADCFLKENDKDSIIFNAAFSSGNYTPYVDKPFLLELSTNEGDGSFDRMAELFSTIGSESSVFTNITKRLSISQSCNHTVGKLQCQNELLWLSDIMQSLDKFAFMPSTPIIQKKVNNDSIYFHIKADSSVVEHVQVFVSASDFLTTTLPQFRYWYQNKVENLGDGEFLSKIDLEQGITEYRTYANVVFKNGYCFSTTMLKTSITLDSQQTSINRMRLVYDGEMQQDDWTVVDRESAISGGVEMVEGPFGIVGVTGTSCELASFKIGDQKYKGEVNNILQLSICSYTTQELTFTVVSKSGFEPFVFKTKIEPDRSWSKLHLRESEFKGKGQLFWNDAVSIKINSQSPVIISNVIWV